MYFLRPGVQSRGLLSKPFGLPSRIPPSLIFPPRSSVPHLPHRSSVPNLALSFHSSKFTLRCPNCTLYGPHCQCTFCTSSNRKMLPQCPRSPQCRLPATCLTLCSPWRDPSLWRPSCSWSPTSTFCHLHPLSEPSPQAFTLHTSESFTTT